MASGVNTTTVNFGATPVREASFVITDANVSAASYVEAFIQHNDSTVDNSVEDHKTAGVLLRLVCAAGAGQFTLFATALIGTITGQMKIRYAWST